MLRLLTKKGRLAGSIKFDLKFERKISRITDVNLVKEAVAKVKNKNDKALISFAKQVNKEVE